MAETIKKYKYEGMTNEQIDVLNRFTQYKSATNTQKKMVEIIGESDMVKDWIYFGFIDTGRLGNDHCSMGHALRYVHYAKNLKTKETIKFGIKCISDFFNITPDKLKMIQQGFVEINTMVNDIVEKFNNKKYDYEGFKRKLNSISEKPEHYNEIKLLLDTGLPLPYSYEKEINSIFLKEETAREFDEFLDKNPKYCSLIVMAKLCSSDLIFKSKHPILFQKMNNIIRYLEQYRTLSDSQIKLLNKIILLDFDDIDNKIELISQLPRDKFLKRGNYDEYQVFKSIVLQYNDWGLSEKQVALIDKIYDKNKAEIEKIVLENVE